MVRVDDTALKYHRDDSSKTYKPVLDPRHGDRREWNLRKLLGSHENAHIAFTLSTQTVMGAFLMTMAGYFTPALNSIQSGPAFIPTLLIMLTSWASACLNSTCTWANRIVSIAASITYGIPR